MITASLLHYFRRQLGGRLRLGGLDAGVLGGSIDVLDQLGYPRSVAAEVALEIPGGRSNIDARSIPVRRNANRYVLPKPHDRGPRHGFDAPDATRRLWSALIDDDPF